MMETAAITETAMRITAGSDLSRTGQTVSFWGNGIQATVIDSNGATIVGWTHDVRFVETAVTERRTPAWAVVVGLIGLFVFLIGIVFFFVKQDVQVRKTALTVVDGATWVTLVNA